MNQWILSLSTFKTMDRESIDWLKRNPLILRQTALKGMEGKQLSVFQKVPQRMSRLTGTRFIKSSFASPSMDSQIKRAPQGIHWLLDDSSRKMIRNRVVHSYLSGARFVKDNSRQRQRERESVTNCLALLKREDKDMSARQFSKT